MPRRTKIIATLGPATDRRGELDALIEAGVDCVRVNFSHGVAEDHRKRIEAVRRAAERHGTAIAVLGDLQGPKIRIAEFRDRAVQLRNGTTFVLDPDRAADGGDATGVGLTYRRLAHDVRVGETLLLDDGNVSLRVESIAQDTIVTRVISGGELSGHKGINLQGGGLSADSLTDKDLADIKMAAALEVDYLAVSFVRNAGDIDRARQLLQAAGGTGHIVAKIERGEALDHIDAIIQAADAVMIARGDLGVEIGDAELPGVQKRISRDSRASNRVVITATQMMQSMVEHPQPTRAEVLDVANAVLDGSDAVMLSAETAVGRHPARVVHAMARICEGAERHYDTLPIRPRQDDEFTSIEEAVAMATMYTASRYNAVAILALTESGATAKWMSRSASHIPIYAVTPHIATQRRVALFRGVFPLIHAPAARTDQEIDREVVLELVRRGLAGRDDRIIITKGDRSGVTGGTNTMKIVPVGAYLK